MIVGIDPSLTGTAVALGGATYYKGTTFSSEPRGPRVKDRLERYEDLVYRITSYIQAEGRIVEGVYIEGYSYGSSSQRECLAEFGGLLRWNLLDLTDVVYEVSPSTLKKFATGTGAGKKAAIAGHVAKRWGMVFKTDDEVDAFALLRLGLVAHVLVEAENEAQRQAVEAVLNPKQSKRKK